jgi:hypothetical protein
MYHSAQSVQKTVVKSWYTYFAERKFVPAFVALVLLVSTGGLSIAAETALPGDALYSLKVNLNEQVRGLTAVTPEAKAKLALEVTDRRLKEAALLSTQGRLNAQTSAIIQEQLFKQAGEVKNQVASLVSVNNIRSAQEVALNFESTLKTHEFILQKLSEQQSLSTTSLGTEHISSIIAAVQTELATTTESRATLQTEEIALVHLQTRNEVTLRLIELRTSIVELMQSETSVTLTDAASSTVNLYIEQANDLSRVAGARIHDGQFADALTLIQKASQYVSDANAIINAVTVDPRTGGAVSAIIQGALTSSTTLPISTVGTTGTTTLNMNSASSTNATSTSATNATSTSSVHSTSTSDRVQ